MPEPKTLYVCTHCDAQFQKWIGRCLECGTWGSLEEVSAARMKQEKENAAIPAKTQELSELKTTQTERIPSKIRELDRVLGDGIVPGSLILLGGEPGIGKSTLALQLAAIVDKTLYISGEESAGQIAMRARRILSEKFSKNIKVLNETNVETIVSTLKVESANFAIIDSIQTLYSEEVSGGAGSPNQIRACTVKLLDCAKQHTIAICIIGHVTKDGAVAGPKTLEHLVDTVLYLEGEPHHSYRVLRAVKNRFGSTDEVGIFEMDETGLREVPNPSEHFLSERAEKTSGSVITCLMEGTRPLLVEIQALVQKTSFGYPVRKASGFDLNRLHVLVAVLQKRAGLNLAQYDIHINVVGGLKAEEPSADLSICLAIASSFKDKILGLDLVVFGEVGLGGEIRAVRHTEKRLKECEQLGMKRVIMARNKKIKEKNTNKLHIIGVGNIEELIQHA
ncbi:MAG: DNA repair protein RadA [Candidatus Magasanikbacteria bacterium]|nr:DNA repair protein RadA [Candidatus Magasanikbacteria bacterium]